MPLLLFCNINRSYIFRRGLDVFEIAEMCWMLQRHEKRNACVENVGVRVTPRRPLNEERPSS